MARVTGLRCDECKKTVVHTILEDYSDLGSWYEVTRSNPREFVEAGDSDRFDFCSLPCLTIWSTHRELVRTQT